MVICRQNVFYISQTELNGRLLSSCTECACTKENILQCVSNSISTNFICLLVLLHDNVSGNVVLVTQGEPQVRISSIPIKSCYLLELLSL
jgi:hypothetical protein